MILFSESLKKEMGYSEEVVRCDKCKYYKEEENKYVDRMWDSFCTYNKIQSLNINAWGKCRFFEGK